MCMCLGLSVAAQLNASPVQRSPMNSFPISVVETKQGIYREYTVEKMDDTALDQIRTNYKTADQTDENKTKVTLKKSPLRMKFDLIIGSFAVLGYPRRSIGGIIYYSHGPILLVCC